MHLTDPCADPGVVADVPIPIPARILRARRRKSERTVLLVSRPAALAAIGHDDAPVAAALIVPALRGAAYWPLHLQAGAIAWVRHSDGGFWRPMAAPDGAAMRVADLEGRIREWAGDGIAWDDWPYAMPQRNHAGGRGGLVAESGLTLTSCSVDVDAEHAVQARALAERLRLIDGFLHVACGEPVVDVIVRGVSEGRPDRIVVAPAAGRQIPHGAEGDVVQTFRGDDAEGAEAYAQRLGGMTGLPVSLGARWKLARPVLGRSDRACAPAEGLARLVSRTAAEIGRMRRPVVEAWLDARDAARRAPAPEEAVGLLRRITGLLTPGASALDRLARWELLRWEGNDAGTEEDLASLGQLA